ncbi:MAG: DUF1428 domain-containing protein [Pseudomonadota bacterium]
MTFVEGFVIPVPAEKKQAYITLSKAMAPYFRKHGATSLVETWEADVPDGEITSFPMAVQRKDGESVVFSWIMWPDKATRDGAYAKITEDMEADGLDPEEMPFDGRRMIFGGFDVIAES